MLNKSYLSALSALILGISLTTSAQAEPQQRQFYGKELCSYPGFTCAKVKRGHTWEKLFPNLREREIVKRLNRTNMPLYMRQWLVVPENLANISHMDIAPFALNMDTNNEPTIIVDLAVHAFGAYNKDGELIHWGPISGGKDFCKDINGPCRTEVGKFRITRKGDKACTSGQFPIETDGGALMPYCMHFNRGIAFHGSTLPGYHGSHGCVRLFYDDAKWLNQEFTKVGTRVIVTG